MFFCDDCDATNYELELKKYQLHHYETGWFPITTYMYLSWPIDMTHRAMSYAIFLIKCPVPKQTL